VAEKKCLIFLENPRGTGQVAEFTLVSDFQKSYTLSGLTAMDRADQPVGAAQRRTSRGSVSVGRFEFSVDHRRARLAAGSDLKGSRKRISLNEFEQIGFVTSA
jgi:hypothetical protein